MKLVLSAVMYHVIAVLFGAPFIQYVFYLTNVLRQVFVVAKM